MALSISVVERNFVNNKRIVWADVTFDDSYATGGESLVAADLGLTNLTDVRAAPASGLIFEYVHSTSKLKALYPTGGATAAAAAGNAPTATATLANTVVPAGGTTVTSSGAQPTLTITQPTVALKAGVAKEVGSTTDLAAVVTRVQAIGY